MRCLLVEDEPARVASIMPTLAEAFGKENILLAQDRDSACVCIGSNALDLVILDQRIPSSAGQLDPDVMHGRAVLSHLREVAPETPVYFLTGLPMEDDYIDHLIAQGDRCDVWGDGHPVALLLRFQKTTLTPFFEAVARIASTARATNEIEINTKGAEINLDDWQARLLKRFARQHSGTCIDTFRLDRGFSGAHVFRLDVKDKQGGVRLSAVGKLGDGKNISGEIERYSREVIRLPAGTYAPLIPGSPARIFGKSGAFYSLLVGYDRSLFDLLRESDSQAAQCVKSMQANQEPWLKNSTTKEVRVGELVELMIWKERLPKLHDLLLNIDWKSFEDRKILVKMCTRHGDLHGDNALLNSDRQVMLIDYGAVDVLPSAIDAVTLELCPFFHPNGERGMIEWTSNYGMIDWFDKEKFSSLTSIPEYIIAARTWAHADSYGNREVLACAYAYLLRQLQFPTTDKELAVALIAGIVSRGMKI